MVVYKNELPISFDIDGTLVLRSTKDNPDSIQFTHSEDPNQIKWLLPHEPHIAFLKRCYHRGYQITLWSANGFAWAEHVAITLGLEKYITKVETKPITYVDDLPADEWIGNRIYIPITGE